MFGKRREDRAERATIIYMVRRTAELLGLVAEQQTHGVGVIERGEVFELRNRVARLERRVEALDGQPSHEPDPPLSRFAGPASSCQGCPDPDGYHVRGMGRPGAIDG